MARRYKWNWHIELLHQGAAILICLAGLVFPLVIKEQKIKPANGKHGDNFGFSVSVSENTMAVGARGTDTFGIDNGMVYLYELSPETHRWLEIDQLSPQSSQPELFGFSVSIYGNSLIVGSYFDDGPNGEQDRGAAYVYNKNNDGVWEQSLQLLANDGAAGEQFGYSVAMSRDTAVVTSWRDEENIEHIGKVHVFERLFVFPESWSQQQLILDEIIGDFGWSVAIHEDVIAAGVRSIADGAEGGAVAIFHRDNGGAGNWGQYQLLTPSDSAPYDSFGYSIALSSDILVVGAFSEGELELESGAVYIFRKQVAGFWDEEAKLMPSDIQQSDLFGFSVALSGTTVLAGAPLAIGRRGATYVYTYMNGIWNEVAKLSAGDLQVGDEFGASVAVSGSNFIIGAYGIDVGDSRNVGAAYFYRDPHTSVQWDECELNCYEYVVDTQCFICNLDWNRSKKIVVQTNGVSITFVDTGETALPGDYPEYAILSNLFVFLDEVQESGGIVNVTYAEECGIPEQIYVDPYVGPQDDEFWVMTGEFHQLVCNEMVIDCPLTRECVDGDIIGPGSMLCCEEGEICVEGENPEEGGSCIPMQQDNGHDTEKVPQSQESPDETDTEDGEDEVGVNGETGSGVVTSLSTHIMCFFAVCNIIYCF